MGWRMAACVGLACLALLGGQRHSLAAPPPRAATDVARSQPANPFAATAALPLPPVTDQNERGIEITDSTPDFEQPANPFVRTSYVEPPTDVFDQDALDESPAVPVEELPPYEAGPAGEIYCGDANCRALQMPGQFFADAWLEQGYTCNPDEPLSGSNLPLTFNDRANEYQLNQLYVVFGRDAAACGNSCGVGGRLDLLYGTDYLFTMAHGLETHVDGSPRWNSPNGPRDGGTAARYGLSMPQLYGEFYAPFGNGLSIKAGHFYSTLGYESAMAPDNFFYSRSYTWQYGQPTTFTGAYAETRFLPNWTAHGGFTRGWDNWEDPNDRLGFLGGIGWRRCDGKASLRFALHAGPEDDDGADNRMVYSVVFTREITPSLTYVLKHNYGTEQDAAVRDNQPVDAQWYSIVNYLTYQVDCESQLGMRAEWFRDDDNARVLAIPLGQVSGGDYFEVTLGANHRPQFCPNWELRSEIRWDWSNTEFPALNVFGAFDDFTSDHQLTLALSSVATF